MMASTASDTQLVAKEPSEPPKKSDEKKNKV